MSAVEGTGRDVRKATKSMSTIQLKYLGDGTWGTVRKYLPFSSPRRSVDVLLASLRQELSGQKESEARQRSPWAEFHQSTTADARLHLAEALSALSGFLAGTPN